jgi:uncharacterized protein with GYD domain
MPSYVILFNFTEQGIRNVKDTIKRAEAFKNEVEKAGGKFLSEYYTFGRYDIVTTVEVPNDESMMSIMLTTGRLGNVRSETMKAVPMHEAEKIIEKCHLKQL